MSETNNQTNDNVVDVKPKRTRVHKYPTEEERYAANKASKRQWYYKNKDKQKLKSLRQYYTNQLKKAELREDIKQKYEQRLNEINEALI